MTTIYSNVAWFPVFVSVGQSTSEYSLLGLVQRVTWCSPLEDG
jgi:hypothetical protein